MLKRTVIRSRRMFVTIIMLLAVFMSAQLATASVLYHDGTFLPAQWQTATAMVGHGGALTVGQTTAGGHPGAYRFVGHNVNPAPAGPVPSILFVLHRRVGASYDPATQGAINSINFSIDYKNIYTSYSGVAFGLALIQDGKVYNANRKLSRTGYGWQSFVQTGLQPSDFGLRITNQSSSIVDFNQHPDFSASAAPIKLGFYTSVANTDTDVHTIQNVGFDNWNVLVNNVPEPASLVLLSLGTVLLRRRKNRPFCAETYVNTH